MITRHLPMKRFCLTIILLTFTTASWIAAAPAAPAAEGDRIREDIFAWVRAWESRDIDRYMAHYHPAFLSEGQDYRKWRQRKIALFKRSGPITIKISQVWIARDQKTAVARFFQEYKDSRTSDIGEKTLEMEKYDGRWRIVSETWTQIHDAIPQLPQAESGAPAPVTPTSPTAKQTPPAAPTPPAVSGVTITGIQFQLSPVEETVIIELTPYAVPSIFSLNGESPRVVIDFRGVHTWAGKPSSTVDGRFIRSIRTHFHKNLAKLRIVLDLQPPGNYKIVRVAHPEASQYMITISPEK